MTNKISPQGVLNELRAVKDPIAQKDIVSLGIVRDVQVSDHSITVILQSSSPARDEIVSAVRQVVQVLGVPEVKVQLIPPSPQAQHGQPNLIPKVKNTIAVASGKGGVGKSTVAANLAVAMLGAGAKVGLMDTDVYGPSVPMLMGGDTPPRVVEGKIEPPVEYGIKIISMAYFLPKEEAVIWRGPMLHKTIHQFLGDVRWGELDYLIIDLPPGTGDIQLSLSQTIPLTGAVIVSTPQDLALTVASKAIAMFQKLNVPILGIVENMSYYVCPHCGHRDDIFGHGGAREAAKKLGFPFLGEIPLDPRIRIQSDDGKPVALDENSTHGKAFRGVAEALAEQVSIANAQVGQGIQID
jgi:ATP-binding protein involved in chromosome partitioning